MAIASLLVIGKYLQELKRRRPDGLHIVYLKKLAQKKFSFINFNYIETSQGWDIRREKPVVRIHIRRSIPIQVRNTIVTANDANLRLDIQYSFNEGY